MPVGIALLLAPAPWTYAILAAGLVGSVVLPLVRRSLAVRAAAQSRPGTIVLGSAGRRPVRVSDQQLSTHGLLLGASGAGKTTTLMRILTEHVHRGTPVVAIDLKGSPDFAEQLAGAAQAAGRPFALWTPDGPSHWNPLRYGNATALKDKLIATERFTEPHYQRAAERYVQTVLSVLHELRPGRETSLADVVALMDPRRLAIVLRDVHSARAEHVKEYLSEFSPDQLSAVRGLATRLAILTESHTGAYLSPAGPAPVLDLRSALAGDEVVVFSLNSSLYGKLAAQLGTLIVQDIVAASGERLSLTAGARPQALIGIDEFSALGGDNVIALLARGRESDLSALLATQELADLDRAARGLRDQVVGVTAIKIVHRQDVPASALTVAQMAGTRRVWERSYQFGPGLFGAYTSNRGVRREAERFVIDPNEIKTLPTGRAVVITKTPAATAEVVQISPPRPVQRVSWSELTAPGPRPAATSAGQAGAASAGQAVAASAGQAVAASAAPRRPPPQREGSARPPAARPVRTRRPPDADRGVDRG